MFWGAHFDKEQLKPSAEGGSGPNDEDLRDETEGGGDTGNGDEEGDCHGSNHKPLANSAHAGSRSAQ